MHRAVCITLCHLSIFAIVACATNAAIAAQATEQPRRRENSFVGVQQTSSNRRDQQLLLRELSRGNRTRVEQLADKLGLNAISKKLLRTQLDYDMPVLLSAAKQCRDRAFEQHQPIAAFRCNVLTLGGAAVLGSAKEIFEAAAWWDKRVTKTSDPARDGLRTALFGEGFDRAEVVRLVATVPPLTAQVSAQSAPIPIVNWVEHGAVGANKASEVLASHPQVDIDVNGHAVRADIDTGTSLPLIIDASHAQGLGIRMLVDRLTAIPTLASPPATQGNASLGLVTNFKFGPLTMHNLAVEVVPDGYAGDGTIVGLPVLARFNHITFTRSHILVDPHSRGCSQPLPLTYAASGTEQLGQLMFAAEVDGTPVTASFDSGSGALLAARPRLAHDSPEWVPGSAQMANKIRYGYLALKVGEGQIASYNAAFRFPWPGPSDVLIGAPLLAFADVQLTFSPLSLCFREQSPQGRQ